MHYCTASRVWQLSTAACGSLLAYDAASFSSSTKLVSKGETSTDRGRCAYALPCRHKTAPEDDFWPCAIAAMRTIQCCIYSSGAPRISFMGHRVKPDYICNCNCELVALMLSCANAWQFWGMGYKSLYPSPWVHPWHIDVKPRNRKHRRVSLQNRQDRPICTRPKY